MNVKKTINRVFANRIVYGLAVFLIAATAASGGEPTVAPASDFEYELASGGKGVKILKYVGKGGDIILPTEIEGMPVTELNLSNWFWSRTDYFYIGNMRSVVIPDSYVPIWEAIQSGSESWFQGGETLEAVTLPNGITRIPHGMFRGCRALKTITIPDTVKVIADEAFIGSGLTSIVIPEGVTTIGNSVFRDSGLTSIIIPEGVTTIGAGAFSGCQNLTSLTLPESIQEIGNSAFGSCVNLETVNLPAQKIDYGYKNLGSDTTGGYTFYGCNKLNLAAQKAIRDSGYKNEFIDVDEAVKAAASRGGSGGNARITGRSGSAPSVTPASDFIYEFARDGAGINIRSYIGSGGNIIVPDTIEGFAVTAMDSLVFTRTAVTSVVLPDSINNLGYGLFRECSQLQTVTLPKGLTSIPQDCFEGCTALTSITIPDTVTQIGNRAFQESGLTSIVIPEGVTKIGEQAFERCPNLTSITLPESIKVIEMNAFKDCPNLETVNLLSHQFDIGSDAFAGCTKLNLAAQKAIRDSGYTGRFKAEY